MGAAFVRDTSPRPSFQLGKEVRRSASSESVFIRAFELDSSTDKAKTVAAQQSEDNEQAVSIIPPLAGSDSDTDGQYSAGYSADAGAARQEPLPSEG